MDALDPLMFGEEQRCFGCGPHNEAGMKLRFHRDGEAVVTTFHAREGWEGPPGIVHGGLQSTLADEIAAWTVVAHTGHFGFTTSMQVRFLRPARTALPIEARGEIIDRTESAVRVRVVLSQEGRKLLKGTLNFALPTRSQAERVLGMELPQAWQAMARPEPG